MVYAPTSAAGRRERATLRQDVFCLVEAAPPSTMIVVSGDLNAELGNSGGTMQTGDAVVGPFAHTRLTTAGVEWRDWCLRHDFRDAGSRSQQRRRRTWRHPRFRTDHELDHFLIHQGDLWHLRSCRILYDGPNVQVSWTPYTDHNPVECVPPGLSANRDLRLGRRISKYYQGPALLRRNFEQSSRPW